MGHQNKDVDEESLQTRDRARARWMDVFLFVSVIVLFLAVTALAVGEYVVVSELSPRPARVSAGNHFSELVAPTPSASAAFKMDNFAYVETMSSVLDNKTVTWGPIDYGKGTSVGSNFEFNPEDHSLTPRHAGAYFLYIEVNLTCTGTCNNLHLSLQVDNVLLCNVDLKGDKRSVSKKCWTVAQLDGKGLVTQMKVSSKSVTHWKLESQGSGLGMFLIG